MTSPQIPKYISLNGHVKYDLLVWLDWHCQLLLRDITGLWGFLRVPSDLQISGERAYPVCSVIVSLMEISFMEFSYMEMLLG